MLQIYNKKSNKTLVSIPIENRKQNIYQTEDTRINVIKTQLPAFYEKYIENRPISRGSESDSASSLFILLTYIEIFLAFCTYVKEMKLHKKKTNFSDWNNFQRTLLEKVYGQVTYQKLLLRELIQNLNELENTYKIHEVYAKASLNEFIFTEQALNFVTNDLAMFADKALIRSIYKVWFIDYLANFVVLPNPHIKTKDILETKDVT